MKQYALYKGDKYLCGGTIYELAKFLVVQPKTIYFYTNTKNQQVFILKGKFYGQN